MFAVACCVFTHLHGMSCFSRKLCFFAHKPDELRSPNREDLVACGMIAPSPRAMRPATAQLLAHAPATATAAGAATATAPAGHGLPAAPPSSINRAFSTSFAAALQSHTSSMFSHPSEGSAHHAFPPVAGPALPEQQDMRPAYGEAASQQQQVPEAALLASQQQLGWPVAPSGATAGLAWPVTGCGVLATPFSSPVQSWHRPGSGGHSKHGYPFATSYGLPLRSGMPLPLARGPWPNYAQSSLATEHYYAGPPGMQPGIALHNQADMPPDPLAALLASMPMGSAPYPVGGMASPASMFPAAAAAAPAASGLFAASSNHTPDSLPDTYTYYHPAVMTPAAVTASAAPHAHAAPAAADIGAKLAAQEPLPVAALAAAMHRELVALSLGYADTQYGSAPFAPTPTAGIVGPAALPTDQGARAVVDAASPKAGKATAGSP